MGIEWGGRAFGWIGPIGHIGLIGPIFPWIGPIFPWVGEEDRGAGDYAVAHGV